MATLKPAHSWASQLTRGCILMGVALFALMGAWPATTWAQSAPPDLNAITAATGSTDASMRMWAMLLGSFANNPFATLGAPDSLLGSLFLVFNGCMFVVGFAWALFGIVGGVVQTAHEGEVLGRRMSTIWFPIRMIVGISGMVPIFGGFTMNQAVMMQLTIIGIGIGNAMWQEGVNKTASFQGLTSQAFEPSVSSQARDVAKVMFLSNLCVAAEKAAQAQATAQGLPALTGSELPEVSRTEDGTRSMGFHYGIRAQKDKCGSVMLTYGAGRTDGSALGFRVASVDYSAIVTAANSAYKVSANTMNTKLVQLADKWLAERASKLAAGDVVPPVPLDEIEAAAASFNSTAMGEIKAATATTSSGIKAAAKTNMMSLGWFGAGAWYSTFAEANAAIADAARQPSMAATFRGYSDSTYTQDVIKAASDGFTMAERAKGAGQAGGDATKALLDSAITDTGCGGVNNLAGTATGNCSFGQGLVSAAIRATAAGSGGGGVQQGGWGLDAGGLVNPLIMLKNMGDYVMTFSSTALTIATFSETSAKIASKVGSAISKVPLPGTTMVGALLDGAGEAAAKGAGTAATLALALLVLGAAMSVYLPMIPFITWMGAILAYAASMIEGLAGATLHSMAHLESEGDGMGQRTSHGYMFYINALGRPALMVIGFFLASGLMIAIGTLQMQLFLPAMASAQGNSITGLASICIYLVIFFVLNWTLVQGSFNLIYVITDQVIGFVGGSVDSKLGRDTEDKAHNMFLVAARTGPHMIPAMLKPKGEGKGEGKEK